MGNCFAQMLGDCDGPLEDEHFIPRALQRMVGLVVIGGLPWQRGSQSILPPSAYAHGRIICKLHHDRLDGLDGNAAAYFRNLTLIANPNHVASGIPGRADDISPLIDGRALERWFVKTICGAIATGSTGDIRLVPDAWVRVLFGAVEWPEEWAIYVATGTRQVTESDAKLQFDFHWTKDRQLNGLIVRAFSIDTVFTLEIPDRADGLLKRPRLLGASVQRPLGGPALQGMAASEHVRFQLSWMPVCR
jgi:hypothetical protein